MVDAQFWRDYAVAYWACCVVAVNGELMYLLQPRSDVRVGLP